MLYPRISRRYPLELYTGRGDLLARKQALQSKTLRNSDFPYPSRMRRDGGSVTIAVSFRKRGGANAARLFSTPVW